MGKTGNPPLKYTSFWLPKIHVEKIDQLVKEGRVRNRSEAIRIAIMRFLNKMGGEP